MKKLVAVILSVIFMFSVFSVSAESELEVNYGVIKQYESAQTYSLSKGVASQSLDYHNIESYIAQQCAKMSEEIVLESYNINAQELYNIFEAVALDYPELFFVGNRYEYKNYPNGQIYSLIPQYTMTKEEKTKASYEYERMVDIIVSAVPASFTDLQKVLYVHDLIDMEAEYDNSLSNFDVYTMLTEHAGVCQAYTLLFEAVMQKVGIECHNATSRNQNHTWNVVKLDGEYYHLDLTWDDTLYADMVSHEFFLLSSETLIASTPAYAVDSSGNKFIVLRDDWKIPGENDIVADSKRFETDEYVWYGYNNPILAVGDSLYMVSVKTEKGDATADASVVRVSEDMKSYQKVATLPESAWWANEQHSSYYPGYYSGFFGIGNVLYGNTADSVWYCEINGETANVGIVATYDFDEYIYHSAIDGKGHVKLYVGSTPSSTQNLYVDHLPLLTANDHNVAQAILNIRKHILGICEDLYNAALFDVNGDLVVNVRDLVHIKRCIAGEI